MTKHNLLLVPTVVPSLAVAVALAACSSPASGIRPHDGGMDVPAQKIDAPAKDYYCPADAMGGGNCPINFCGTLETAGALAANPPGYGQSGADSICNSGRVCIVGQPVPAGDAFQLTCVAPMAGALAFGAPCNPAMGMHCADDSLCIASADFQSQPFCATMCRNDADCPTSSSCLDYQTTQAPDGTKAHVGMCTPASKIAATACTREGACPAGQGCVAAGDRTSLTVCKVAPVGATKTVGTACGSPGECLSGACYDQEFKVAGGASRTYCSSVCAFNSDCGPDQVCARIVQNNNGTPNDPTDDVVGGVCQTLFIPLGASGCNDDAFCVARADGSDTCDVTHGLCYNKSAVPGSACTSAAGCMVGGVCSMDPHLFPGGYCQLYGCAPSPTGATPSVNLCPGAGSVCLQRGGPDAPLYACYDGCQLGADAAAQMCLRASAGYFCVAPSPGKAASICLGQGGT